MSKGSRKRHSPVEISVWWWLVGLIALGTVAFCNTFDVPFVFDDLATIQKNTDVRFGVLNWSIYARSVQYLTYSLNFRWTGQEVWSYHLVNLVLHLLNGALLFFLAANIFRKVISDERQVRLYSFAAACFFVVHPVQTEAVTYVSQRSELLSTAFYLLAFLAFVKWPENRIGFGFSLLILVPFLLGLGAKETVISLPVALFVYDFIFLSQSSFKAVLSKWRFYITFLLGGVAATYYILTVALSVSVGPGAAGSLSRFDYFLTQQRVIVRYISLVFFPAGLNLDYDFRPSTSLFQPTVIASFLFLSAILVLGWFLRKRQPVFAFSIFFFFVALAPTSSVIPIPDVIFEHRLYLPMIGICLSFPGFVVAVADLIRGKFGFRFEGAAYAAVLLGILTALTIMRNQVWRDDVRLFEDVVDKSPLKDRAYNSLSFVLFKKGEYDHAIAVVQKGLDRIPEKRVDFADTLGNLYLKTRRYDEAAELFKETIRLYKDNDRIAVAYNNLGVAYLYKWNEIKAQRATISDQVYYKQRELILPPASEAFLECVKRDPAMEWCWHSYVTVAYDLDTANQLETDALARLQTKEAFNDLYAVGEVNFLRSTSETDEQRRNAFYARADEYFERAEKLKSDIKILFFNHGYILNSMKQKDRAIDKYTQAIRIDPVFIEAHYNVGLIYWEKRNFREAIDHFSEMLRYDPNHIGANLYLARSYAAIGDKTSARKYVTAVLTFSPGNQDAMKTAQDLGL